MVFLLSFLRLSDSPMERGVGGRSQCWGLPVVPCTRAAGDGASWQGCGTSMRAAGWALASHILCLSSTCALFPEKTFPPGREQQLCGGLAPMCPMQTCSGLQCQSQALVKESF